MDTIPQSLYLSPNGWYGGEEIRAEGDQLNKPPQHPYAAIIPQIYSHNTTMELLFLICSFNRSIIIFSLSSSSIKYIETVFLYIKLRKPLINTKKITMPISMSKYRPYQIAIVFIIIVFVVGGIWDVLLHDLWAYDHPIYKFIYGGLLSSWDAIIGLFLGAYLGWTYYKKKNA